MQSDLRSLGRHDDEVTILQTYDGVIRKWGVTSIDA
jgi:hypothetical protein